METFMGRPVRRQSLAEVKATLAEVKAKGDDGADIAMARLLARFANLDDDARDFAARYAKEG